MRKLLLLLSMVTAASAFGQITNFGFGGVKIPMYMASTNGGNYATPVVFRARIIGLTPNQSYKYFARAIQISDTSSKAAYPGAGRPMFLDSGSWKTATSPSWTTAGGHDTFWTNGAGEYEGWFGFIPVSDSRFTPGKDVYPLIIAKGLSATDSIRTYGMEAIRVLGFGKGSGADSCTGVWGKSLAASKSFVALYDNVNGTGRPLSMTMVEKDEISISGAVGYYSSNVDGAAGYWGAILPNNNSNGLLRIEKLDRYNGQWTYANTDADGKWGPSNKNTINPAGGSSSPIALDENDAALISPMIEFAARTSTTNEGAGVKEVYVVRKYSNSQAQSVRIRIVGGTALKTNDYTLTEPRTITFQPGGQAQDTTKITIVDDNLTEGNETVVLQLDQASNCVIGTELAHTMTISDNDVSNVTLPNKLVVVKEIDGTAGIKVKIDQAISSPATLQLVIKKQGVNSFIPGEFKLGSSYYDSTFTLGKSTGPDSIIIKANVIDDVIGDENDTFYFVVRQKSGFAKIGTDSTSTVVVIDNDGPAYIKFVDQSISITEGKVGSVKVRIKVVYKTDAGGDFTLRLLTGLTTASQTSDFTFSPTSQIINIDKNTPDTISVSVPIVNDDIYELTEKMTFNLGILSNIVLVKPDTMTVTILDDDLPQYPLSVVTKQSNAAKTVDSLNVKCRVTGTVHGVDLLSGNGVQFTIMDKTSGIQVLSSTKNFNYTVAEGDSLMIQGTIGQIDGLATISQLDTIRLIAKNKALRTPNISSDVDESTESRMTKFTRVILVNKTDWPTSALSANTIKIVPVKHTDGTVDSLVIDAETNLDGTTAPNGYINVTGIGTQIDNTSPYTGRYALAPRYLNDIEAASLPVVQFKLLSDTVTELADSFTFGFKVAPLDENFTYDVVVKGGTATILTDYNFTKRTISVIKNNSVNPIKCDIRDDAVYDGTKTVIFAIRNVVGPGSIGADSVMILIIKDDEPDAVKSFALGNIKMFPNPAAGNVFIRANQPMKSVAIFAADGRLVFAGQNASEFDIPLTISAGLYMVKVIDQNGNAFAEQLIVR